MIPQNSKFSEFFESIDSWDPHKEIHQRILNSGDYSEALEAKNKEFGIQKSFLI